MAISEQERIVDVYRTSGLIAGVTNNACGSWAEQIARASIGSADRARPVRR